MRVTSAVRHQGTSVVVYGIGNHQFPSTKHSLGQVLVEALAARAALAAGGSGPPNFTWDKALHAWTCCLVAPLGPGQAGQHESRITFMKSKYPMNLSGQSAVQLFKRNTERQALQDRLLFVAHDELSLPSCTYNLKLGGSAKGHNGLRDLAARLKTSDFHRIRIGIGRPGGDSDNKRTSNVSIADWCLSPSTRDEMELCSDPRSKLAEAAWEYIQQQSMKAINVQQEGKELLES